MKFDLDTIIIIGFLITNLIFGLFSGRGIKSIKEYAIGSRNFSTATISATIAATWLGGHSFSITTSEIYNQGLYFAIPGLGDALSFFIVSYFYAPRMGEFLGKLSVAEAMGSIYNKHVRAITALFGILPAIANVAMQFSVLATLLNHYLGISGIYTTVISGFIVIIYATFGGIKSITFTDIIQFFTFGVIIPMVAFMIWSSFADTEAVFNTIKQNSSFNYRLVLDYRDPNFINILFLFLFFMIPGIDSAIFQRISMSRNTLQVSQSFIIAGFFIILFDHILDPFIAVSLKTSTTASLDSNNIIGYIMDNYLGNGLKGLFIIGIMAMIMSTADSYINSSAVLFTYDFCRSINIKFLERQELLFVRISSLVIGIAALLISLFSKNLFELMLSGYSFYMPVVSVIFILAIFGFRSSSRAVLIGMTVAFITVISFKMFSDVDSTIPGMLANLIFFIGSHYILGEQGGWVGIKDRKSLDNTRLERKRKTKHFIQLIRNFNFIKFCQKNTVKEEKILVYFGLFCMITIFSNAYSLSKSLQEQYATILSTLYYSVLTLSTIFITYPFWAKKFRNEVFISVLWNIAVFYNLIFCSSLLTIIGHFNQIQVTVLMASLITVAILMRWQIAILMIVGGVLVSIQCYKMYNGISSLPDYMNDLQFKITYSLLLVSGILIAFFKPKQQHQELTEDSNLFLSSKVEDQKNELSRLHELKNEFLRNLEHEAHTPITGITSMGQVLWENYDKFSETQRRKATQEIAKSSERLNSLVNNLIDLSKLENLNYKLNKTTVNLTDLVYERVEICQKLYIEEKDKENLNFDLKIEDKLTALCDEYYIARTIDNIVINAIQYSTKGIIAITLKSTKNHTIEFSVQDDGIGIPEEDLLDIFNPFTVSSRTKTPAGGRGVGLALCKKVIDAHNGIISAKNNDSKGSLFRVILPK
jgi:Na+/proline symporter/signal transduction histidine kinase